MGSLLCKKKSEPGLSFDNPLYSSENALQDDDESSFIYYDDQIGAGITSDLSTFSNNTD